MRMVSPAKSGYIDGVVNSMGFQNLNISDISFVPVTFTHDYQFNEELLNMGKYILFDFVEYGWGWDMAETHFFGKNTRSFEGFSANTEWHKLCDFVKENPPLVYFKRELLKKDFNSVPNVYPIEYCWMGNDIGGPVSFEAFCNKKIDLFYCFGISHEMRKSIYCNIFSNASDKLEVLTSIYDLESFFRFNNSGRPWVTHHSPHYNRMDIHDLINIQSHSVLSLSPPGAGLKCFRHSESCLNSIMVLFEDDMQYTYDWEHGVNCFKIKTDVYTNYTKEFQQILSIDKETLYNVYCNGVNNSKKYYLSTYLENYIKPVILTKI
jgi:hypothetical protein